MGVFADKLKAAGFDTFEQQFAALAIQALQNHSESVVDAWRWMGSEFGHEYLRERMKDMQGPKATASPQTPLARGIPVGRPSKPTVQTHEPSNADLRAMKSVNERISRNILDLRRTSDGRQWGAICPYEFKGMQRDAAIANAFDGLLGPLNEKQQQTQLRMLLTDKQARLVFEGAPQ